MDPRAPVGAATRGVNLRYLRQQTIIFSLASAGRARALSVVATSWNLQYLTHHCHRVLITMGFDELIARYPSVEKMRRAFFRMSRSSFTRCSFLRNA